MHIARDSERPVLSIPQSIILTLDRAIDSCLGEALRRFVLKKGIQDKIWPKVYLWLYMIREKHDPTSFHGPYLRAVPETYTDPLWFSKKELKECCMSLAHTDGQA